jgi:hypothetical protein
MKRIIMTSTITYLLSVSCTKPSVQKDQIAGVYVKETVFEVIHPITDNRLGVGRIRDTIFIAPKQNGFEVSNNKWRLDEFNDRGWQNLQHEENHPMPTYQVSFDPTDSSLNPVMSGLLLAFKLDLKNQRLQKGKNKRNIYLKVK